MKSNNLLIPSIMLCILGLIDIDYKNIATLDIAYIVVVIITISAIIFNLLKGATK